MKDSFYQILSVDSIGFSAREALNFALLEQFGLVIEHGKFEVFHFSRSYRLFNLPPLNLSCFKDLILKPKNT